MLTARCPDVLDGISVSLARTNLERRLLHCSDCICDENGVLAVRMMREAPDVPRGVIVTSDGEVMVVPGALGDRILDDCVVWLGIKAGTSYTVYD